MRYLLLTVLLVFFGCESEQDAIDRMWAEEAIALQATNVTSDDHFVSIDAYVDDGFVRRVYFNGDGKVDFLDCFVDTVFNGECVDDEGATWIFEGAAE